jgi:hypothetical protein
MPLTLQSSVEGFDASFMQAVPELERMMRKAGLDPSDFIIAKDRGAPGTLSFDLALYHYSVFVGGTKVTITEPDDSRFLDYFRQRIASERAPVRRRARRPNALVARVRRWILQPV